MCLITSLHAKPCSCPLLLYRAKDQAHQGWFDCERSNGSETKMRCEVSIIDSIVMKSGIITVTLIVVGKSLTRKSFYRPGRPFLTDSVSGLLATALSRSS